MLLCGRAQSEGRVALHTARTQLHAQELEKKKIARKKLGQLRAEQKKIQCILGKGKGGVSPSRISVEAGEIRVQPSFADMLLVKRLGGRFRGSLWRWPATPANARMLRAKLRAVEATAEFDALVGPMAAAVEKHFETTPPEEVVANAEALTQSTPVSGISEQQQSITLPTVASRRSSRTRRSRSRLACGRGPGGTSGRRSSFA